MHDYLIQAGASLLVFAYAAMFFLHLRRKMWATALPYIFLAVGYMITLTSYLPLTLLQ